MAATFDRNRLLVFPRPMDAGNHIVFGEAGFYRRGFRFQAAVEQSAGLDVTRAFGQVDGGFSATACPRAKGISNAALPSWRNRRRVPEKFREE